jgi:hypothetical protein
MDNLAGIKKPAIKAGFFMLQKTYARLALRHSVLK